MSKIYTAIISLTLDAEDDTDATETCNEIANSLNYGRGGNMDVGAACVIILNDKGVTIKQ